MAGKRDYKAEYKRRIERGLKRGLSRSQARGHPKANEKAVKTGSKKVDADPRLEEAVKRLRSGESQAASARAEGISADRLRRFTYTNKIAKRVGGKWVMTDDRARRVKVLTNGSYKAVTVSGFDEASKAGAFENAAGKFVRTNEKELLLPFMKEGVTDLKGRFYPFETDGNELHRIANMDVPPFHEIYEIVSD